jgi:sterol desaturase/sphingolipid hydroxylase (fatty acid hydroxylase superfamily)
VNRARSIRLWPYAAAIGVVAGSLILFIIFERQTALDLWSWAIGFAEAKSRRLLSPTGALLIGTTVLLVMELFFLNWEKTTIFVVFFRRSASAMVDVGSMVFFFLASFKAVAEYVFTFGIAFAIARLVDAAAVRFDWVRWQLPSEGILGIAAGIVVFYLFSSFIGYWQHRMMHWRWFWYLHRFHHAATEINILTSFRANPAEAFRLLPFAIPLFFVRPPSAEMFAAFTVANQLLALLQHSELPWSLGWLGRWLIVSPQYHQIHHSMDEEHRDLNFSVCPIWDRLFGTWYSGSKAPSSYGIPDTAHIARPFTQWIIDIWIFYRDVARLLASVAKSVLGRVRLRRPLSKGSLDATASIPAE